MIDIWLQLTLLLSIAVVSHFAITRLGQPSVIGEVLVGIIIGPTLIGAIFPSLAFDPSLVSIFAQLGAIVLLFIVGLECDLREIYTKKSIAIALAGIVVPLLGGYALSILVGYDNITSIFMGVVLVATSVGITAATLLELGVINTPTAKQIIGAAVIDDILAMLILAISPSLATGSVDLMHVFILTVAALSFILMAILWSPRICKLIELVEDVGLKRGLQHSGFMLALAFTFLYAFLAEQIGISAIVGAFVAGTTFSGVKFKKEFHAGASTLSAVFTPIFFISLGVIVNVWELTTATLIFSILLILVAIGTKLIGCGLVARLSGYSSHDSIIIGAGMIPRGEVAMIIAVYGISIGIINTSLYTIAVMMALVTTLVTPPALKYLYKKHKHETRRET
jgi:Kef-type K+ transport system membrane component KefB